MSPALPDWFFTTNATQKLTLNQLRVWVTDIYSLLYIYIYVCVCVCVCVFKKLKKFKNKRLNKQKGYYFL